MPRSSFLRVIYFCLLLLIYFSLNYESLCKDPWSECEKTAERLVVEMKDRLKGWGAGDLFTPFTDAAPTLLVLTPHSRPRLHLHHR